MAVFTVKLLKIQLVWK